MHWVKITYRVPDGEASYNIMCKSRAEARTKIQWAGKHTDTIIKAERFEGSKVCETLNGWAYNDEIPF